MTRNTQLPFYHPEDPFFLYHDLYPSRQVKLWLDISTHCNAKCPQCHRTDPKGLGKVDWLPVVQWSFDQFKFAFPPKTLEMFKEIQICGTWGDPMMNKDIYEIMEYIMDNSRVRVLLNTNGSIRDEEWWWKFGIKVRNRCTVFWAIEGITKEQHAKYRQNTDLDKILRNMESFSAAGGISEIFTVVFKHNERDMYNIAKIGKDLGAKQIMFIQSNRFYNHSKFDFVDDQDSELQSLYRAELPENKEFYWKSWELFNPVAMEIIKNEASRAQ